MTSFDEVIKMQKTQKCIEDCWKSSGTGMVPIYSPSIVNDISQILLWKLVSSNDLLLWKTTDHDLPPFIQFCLTDAKTRRKPLPCQAALKVFYNTLLRCFSSRGCSTNSGLCFQGNWSGERISC